MSEPNELPKLKHLTIGEGHAAGSWISFPDLRNILEKLEEEYPEYAAAFIILDRTLLDSIMSR